VHVYLVNPIALKPIPLDFTGYALSINVIESVKNIPKIVIVAYTKEW
jgi:hypothetical protein